MLKLTNFIKRYTIEASFGDMNRDKKETLLYHSFSKQLHASNF